MKTKLSNFLIGIGIFAIMIQLVGAGNCPAPTPAGTCGNPSQGPNCNTKCIKYTCTAGAANVTLCLGHSSDNKCNTGTTGWSCVRDQYPELTNPTNQLDCIGCDVNGSPTNLDPISGTCTQATTGDADDSCKNG